MPQPTVSVVMPVHNALPYLDESVESILRQSFTDFEFVIGDNGSIDGTSARLQHWAQRDSRIRLLHNPHRLGPARSSNWVVEHARCDLIARMDADDVAHPERLLRQVRAMARQPDASLIGTLFDTIDETGRPVRPPGFFRVGRVSPTPAFCHPTILLRRSAFDRAGGYRSAADYWEDTDLYWRLAESGRLFVLPENLMTVRHSTSSSRGDERLIRVDEAVDDFCRSLSAYRSGCSPFDLPRAAQRAGGSRRKLLPLSFAYRAALPVWAGKRPDVARRMYGRIEPRFDMQSLMAAASILWGTLAPRSMRWFLLAMIRLRNARMGPVSSELVEWLPRRVSAAPHGNQP
ncbi:glycosyltransferase family 2 protein [Sphingomonas sp. LM7]|uniref:glycosyltransferase family 2 protein n=1 Tax=Sphingomonas sp. LM7 TaxID=1938607 RepID=UPI000983CBBA|nr:glycosyltransferase family 2 protein [Sphingomonas sp. LM7]AQR72317.1 hypothetical protein BXU08_00325 [Sphingomonas sp. LM7]